jgi:ABC-type antimicrobial peptide transport system permease subunit
MALGAAPTDALWLVMRETLGIAAVGLAVGAPLALIAGRAIASQLYDVGVADPRVLIGAATVLAIAAFIAGLAPGRRASRVDPIIALRAN